MSEVKGLFFESLKMNSKEIRDSRAKQIGLGGEMAYKGQINQLYFALNSLLMDQEGSLDLSPDNALGFVKVSDFDPEKFSKRDIELSLEIRNAAIKFIVAVSRYEELFGKSYDITAEERERIIKIANL